MLFATLKRAVQRHAPFHPIRRAAVLAPLMSAVLLAACGGGGDDALEPGATCSVVDQNLWLQSVMREEYFWYAYSANPDPTRFSSPDDYFAASLYAGGDPQFPADRWSYVSSTADYNRFFVDGANLGYGVLVAALEVSGLPDAPLRVRYVEPGSPAALAGLARGDQLLSVNGQPASALISAGNYSALSADAAGQLLTLSVRNASGDRSLTLTSASYPLAPVTRVSVLNSPGGRKLGYVMIKDMVSQARSPIDAAFADFRAAGVQEAVIDLRYNGGGLVSVAADIASYPAAQRTAGQTFANLLYNDKQQSRNQRFGFTNWANSLALTRVYVLTGPRTCSASEQVINGLRPFVDVVTIGDTTCGKPVGFEARDGGCGSVWSAVNFESANALNEGRYFDGFAATCPVADDLSQPLGSATDPLVAAAALHADTGACPAVAVSSAGSQRQSLMRRAASAAGSSGVTSTPRLRPLEPGEGRGMLGR
ncbi:S41 family peptidase [Ideonella sp.]|uniref:S41 family peptidase n=1 Tax=Ideonella sp. TaxID=1929293 RepID=UPI003BB73CA9